MYSCYNAQTLRYAEDQHCGRLVITVKILFVVKKYSSFIATSTHIICRYRLTLVFQLALQLHSYRNYLIFKLLDSVNDVLKHLSLYYNYIFMNLHKQCEYPEPRDSGLFTYTFCL